MKMKIIKRVHELISADDVIVKISNNGLAEITIIRHIQSNPVVYEYEKQQLTNVSGFNVSFEDMLKMSTLFRGL